MHAVAKAPEVASLPNLVHHNSAKVNNRRIVVMRHGESIYNATHILSSSLTSENGLTATGKDQVRTNAAHLIKAARPDKIFASPLQRTKDTAAIVAEVAEIALDEIIEEPLLREPNFGSFDGGPFPDYLKHFGENRAGTYLIGAPDGEHGSDHQARINAFLNEVTSNPIYEGKTIVVVGHLYTMQFTQKYFMDEHIPVAKYPKNAECYIYA